MTMRGVLVLLGRWYPTQWSVAEEKKKKKTRTRTREATRDREYQETVVASSRRSVRTELTSVVGANGMVDALKQTAALRIRLAVAEPGQLTYTSSRAI